MARLALSLQDRCDARENLLSAFGLGVFLFQQFESEIGF